MQYPQAYNGDLPYIFISYAHKDAEKVMPVVVGLQNRGFRVWYDAGIEVASEWPEFIAQHLADSACVVAFISNNALDSHNCRREINFAISLRKDPLVVYLEEVELSLGMQMQLGSLQALYHRQGTAEDLAAALDRAALLTPCRENLPPRLIDLRQKALQGDDKSQFSLGLAYDNGDEVPQNIPEAMGWYRMAAEQGHRSAQYNLGLLYRKKNQFANAIIWYKKAMEQGHLRATFNLGWIYDEQKQIPEAIQYYEIAAAQGHEKAQYNLGLIYDNKKQIPEAIRYYEMAAAQGHISAAYNLGLIYYNQKQYDKAFELFQKAANQGHGKSYGYLGRCYEHGYAVEKDLAKAKEMYQIAADKDIGFAKERLKKM